MNKIQELEIFGEYIDDKLTLNLSRTSVKNFDFYKDKIIYHIDIEDIDVIKSYNKKIILKCSYTEYNNQISEISKL